MDNPPFVVQLYCSGFLFGDAKESIAAKATRANKAAYFLDECINPGFDDDNTNPLFTKLLELMERSDDEVLNTVAKDIKSKMQSIVWSNQCYGCTSPFKQSEEPEDCIKCHHMFCSGCIQITSEELEGGHGSSKKHKPKICFSCSRADKEICKKQQEAETLENLERKYKNITSKHSAKSVQRLRTNEDKEFEQRFNELRSSHQASSIPTEKVLEKRVEKLKATTSDSSSPNTSKKENAHNPELSVDKKDFLLPSKKTEAEETLAQDEEISQRIYNLKYGINRPFCQNLSSNIQTAPFNTARSTEEQASETEPNVEEQKRKENDACSETNKYVNENVTCFYMYAHV